MTQSKRKLRLLLTNILQTNFTFCRQTISASMEAQLKTQDTDPSVIANKLESALRSASISPPDGVLSVQINSNLSVSVSKVAQGCKNA